MWPRKPRVHHATVVRVEQAGYDTYWFATCDGCDWIDVPCASEQEAFAAARAHTDDVTPDVELQLVPPG